MPASPRQKKRRGGKPAAAEGVDRHVLYEQAVQSPEADIEFCLARFRQHRSRDPKSLREDFCGTAYLSAQWLAGDNDRTALGVDLDRDTLDWGRRRHFADSALAERIDLECRNVLEVSEPRVELTCAMNFSFCVFKTRPELLRYFEAVHAGLTPDGLFITEIYGGTEAIVEIEDERELDNFTFIWEQEKFNPITHEVLCHIHFRFRDGSVLEKAFSYDWRLWSIPEVKELLLEAGFAQVEVHWEETDEDGDGTGIHHLATEEENQESWLVYIVAVK
ncbi:MAG: SAM-dependent methyltransferase [Thermoanaerobaculia bacterium]